MKKERLVEEGKQKKICKNCKYFNKLSYYFGVKVEKNMGECELGVMEDLSGLNDDNFSCNEFEYKEKDK